MDSKKFSIINRVASFKHAFNGIRLIWINEHNARIHFAAAVVVIGLGLTFNEWLVLVLSIGFVLVTEVLNSAIEYLADHVTPDFHESIKKVKDVSAAAVLISAIISLIIGIIIFGPHLFRLIDS